MLNKALLFKTKSMDAPNYLPSYWGTADNWEHLEEPYRSIRELLRDPPEDVGHYLPDRPTYLLEDLPSDLFKYCTKVTSLAQAFMDCSELTFIPSDLFKHCTEVTDLERLFAGCSGLTSIPPDLFKYCTKVTNFEEVFSGCNSLTTIPSDLFKTCTKATNFTFAFEDCVNLTTVPSDLFKYSTVAKQFRSCFRNCDKITQTTLYYGNHDADTSGNPPQIKWEHVAG